MFVGQTVSLSWFKYLNLGEGFFEGIILSKKMLSNQEILRVLRRKWMLRETKKQRRSTKQLTTRDW